MAVRWHPSRRDFLRSLGVSSALAPFLPLMNSSMAETLTPKRLVLFWTPHGQYLPAWTPQGSTTNFVLGPALAPLTALQQKINVIYGVGMKGGYHQNAMQLWTGSYLTDPNGEPTDADIPTNSSIDQTIAAAFGSLTPYPVLNLGAVGGYGGVLSNTIVNNGQPVQAIQDPNAAFTQLFGSSSAQLVQNRASVLNAVNSQLTSLQSRLPASDRYKMAAHIAAVAALETRLTSPSAICTGPTFTSNTNTEPQNQYSLEMMIQIAVAAMQCDLTRIITLEYSVDGNDGNTYPWLGVNFGHHPMTHMSPSDTLDPNGNPTSDQTMSVNGQLTRIYTWYAQQFANLCSQLNAIPEGSGTMLDNTLLVWGTELAHCYTHQGGPGIPLVTAGGLGGTVTTGRWLNYMSAPQDHNRLLVSICRLMGLTATNTYGLTDVGTGPLTGF